MDAGLSGLAAETRAFYAYRAAGRGPGSRDELRAARAATPAPARATPAPSIELVGDGDQRVPVRIHRPVSGPAHGVLLDIHGGGFYMGSAARNDVRNRCLVEALNIVVVSVDYRLAPEHPWPAAPDDCEAAALWLAEHAESRFDTTSLAIGGFSAGATLAVATLLRLRDRGVAVFRGGVLQFGTYDLSAQTPAGRLIRDEYFLDAYAGAAPDRTHPDLSPVFADLVNLPPVLMVVGSDDVLLEDNLATAARMSAAGVECDLRVYPACPHGFTGHPTPMAQAARDGVDEWLHRILGTRPLADAE